MPRWPAPARRRRRAGGQCAAYLMQRPAGVVDAAHGQAGIGKDPAGGKPHPRVLCREIDLRFLQGLFRLAAEIVILRQGDVPRGARLHPFNGLHAVPRPERGVHQGHEAVEQLRRFLGDGGSGLLFLPAGVAGLPGVSRDGPGAAEALRPGDAPLGAVLVDAPLGHAPFFRCFCA